jgi:hypothetical protein
MVRVNSSLRLAVCVTAAMVTGCSGGGRGADPRERPRPSLSAPFEVRGVMEKVQSTFRDAGDGFSVSQGTYVAWVSPDGQASFTPRLVTAPSDGEGEAFVDGGPVGTPTVREGAPARVSTRDIRRGERSLMEAGEALRDADGSVLIPRGAILERLESTERGLEQTWTFPARPEGQGPLTVRVAMAGLSEVGATAGGLHFRDDASGIGIRYGHATWVDGVGRATDVVARLDGGEIVITIPEELVERSEYPAVLDPLVSAELDLDDEVTYWSIFNPQVASNGSDFLVAWADAPSGSAGTRIVGARVSRDGVVLDPAGIVLSAQPVVFRGALAAVGNPNTGTYLVTWNSTSTSGAPYYVYDVTVGAAKVAADGTVTTAAASALPRGFNPTNRTAAEGNGFVVPAMTSSGEYTALRFDGAPGLITWQQAGTVPYDPAWGSPRYVAGIGCHPSGGCLLTWMTGGGLPGGSVGVWGASLAAGGTLGPAVQLASGGTFDPSFITQAVVTSSDDGMPFLVTWPVVDGGAPQLKGLLVEAGGAGVPALAPATPAPVPLTGPQARPRVSRGVYDGTNFVVVWGDVRAGSGSTNFAARVSPATGAVLAPAELQLSKIGEGSFGQPAFARNTGVGLVQWNSVTESLLMTRFWDAPEGLVLDRPGGMPIGVQVGHSETLPKTSFDGARYLVTWLDDRVGSRILGARVSQAGTVIDAAPVLLVPLSTIHAHTVTFNGQHHVVTWVDRNDHTVRLARLTPELTLLDPLGIELAVLEPTMAEASGIRTVASGTDVLVTWPVVNTVTGARELWGRRVSGGGVLLDPMPVRLQPSIGSYAAVASDGNGWFVAYPTSTSPSSATVRAFRIGPSGAVGPDAPIADTASAQQFPDVAFDGTNYRVVWRDYRTGGYGQLWTSLFDRNGDRLPAPDRQVTSTPTPHNQTAVVWDGANVLVLWHDKPTGSPANLLGTWVAADGTLLDSATGLAAGAIVGPKGVESNGAGTVLVAYTTLDPVTRTGRVMARLVTRGASLQVSRSGSGSGRVLSAPAGIDCGTSCTAAFTEGATVTLTAAPEPDSVFAGWSGACAGTGTCTVAVSGAHQVTAKFDRAPATGSFPLVISTAGTGSGYALASPTLGLYPAGTVVTVTAIADDGTATGIPSRFTGWSGACRGSNAACTIVVQGPVELSAIFDLGTPVAKQQVQIQLLPGAGPLEGGTDVTLTGYGFVEGTSVTFAGTPCAVRAISWSSMVVTAPPRSTEGPVDVVISVPGSGATTLPAAFTYFGPSSNTPVGSEVTVVPSVPADAPTVQMRFEEIEGGGQTTITALDSAPPVPPEFFVVAAPGAPKFLEIETAASFQGKVELAVKYDPVAMGLTAEQERNLRLIHFDGTRWEDVTEVANPHSPPYGDADPHYFGRNSPPFLNPDTRTRTLYGVVSSFSPVAVAVGSGGGAVDVHVAVIGEGSGEVAGPGIVCTTATSPCSAAILDGSSQAVTFTATPDPGSKLHTWVGACGGTGVCNPTLNGAKWIIAEFKPDSNPLTVTVWGGGVVTSMPAGISCRVGSTAGCLQSVADTGPTVPTVTLTASPDAGWIFKGWSAPCQGSTSPTCVVPVAWPMFVTAAFEPATLPITLTPFGDGQGEVTASWPGASTVTCNTGQPCTLQVPNTTPPTRVTFTATASADSLFLGWTGVCAGTGVTCNVDVVGSSSLNAHFAPATYSLTVWTNGNGVGTVTGGGVDCRTGGAGTCAVALPNSRPPLVVTLRAVPLDARYVFAGWAGSCSGLGDCVVTMSAARNVIARFDLAP